MKSDFHGKTWFITGATGLVGSTIVSKLLETDVKIIVLVRQSTNKKLIEELIERGVQVFYGNLLDKETFKNQIATCDVVVHVAAAVQNKNVELTWKINQGGTRSIAEAMVETGVRRIIHISTVGVYGRSSKHLIDETTDIRPVGAYSDSKYAAELELLKHQDDLDITMFRPCYIIGNVKKDRHMIPTLSKFLRYRIFPKLWRKDPKFGFIHAGDIASATMLAGSIEKTPHNVYNLQSFIISFSQLVKISEEVFNKKTMLIPIPFSLIYILAMIPDLFSFILRKPRLSLQRTSMLRYNWTFSTERIETDLKWVSQYSDYMKLQTLLLQYNNNVDPNNNHKQVKQKEINSKT